MPRSSVVHGLVRAVDGLPIHFRRYGTSGPVLILLHGWSCRQDFWDFQVAPLAERYQVVTLDLPGHGLSGVAADSRPWSIATFGADVVGVADAIGVESVALIGHSMGGAVAIEAALRLGPRCRLLLGVDTFDEAAFYGARPASEIAARREAFEQDFSGTMHTMVRNITAPSVAPELAGWIGTMMAGSNVPVSLNVLEALLAWDIETRWSELRAPVVTINSAMLARRNELLQLSGLDVHRLENVGHFPMMEDPAAFNALALEILDRHLGG